MKPEQAAEAVREEVEKKKKSINRQVRRRSELVNNALLSAKDHTFYGIRSGRIYKKPGTGTNTNGGASPSTRKLMKEYNHKLRKGGQLYRASAPGEVPARRLGGLKKAWTKGVDSVRGSDSGSTSIVAYIESRSPYAGYLEHGTKNIAPRPYVDRIRERARPEAVRILSEDYD